MNNREQLMTQMCDSSMAICFAGKAPKKSADENYPFTPNRHFYYLTGIDEQEVILVLIKDTKESYLFIKEPDAVMAKWVGETISKEDAKSQSGIKTIKYLSEFTSFLNQQIQAMHYLYLDLERDTFDEGLSSSERFANQCKEKYPYVGIKNLYPIVSKMRMIKAPEEIAKLQRAIDITKEGIASLMENARAGIYEYQLEACFDFVLKSNGVKDHAFRTIAASGKNATVLHYDANNSLIAKDSLILFDLGAQYDYYNADITRTFPVSGKFTKRQKQIYEIVLEGQRRVIEAVKPGIRLRDLNTLLRAYYVEALSEIGLVKNDEELSRYYYHSVSHLLGLDTHDVGEHNPVLMPGMVITVEPGLYIEEEGIGIRIEDDVVVTEDGCDVLSKDIIKSVEDIESFMK